MLHIPPQAAILDRAVELRSDAQRQNDASAVKALDSIIVTVVCHYASLEWDGGYLMVASLSHPGTTHAVSVCGCSCEARKPCYHMRLRELLVDMFETEAETADMECDPPGDCPLGDEDGDSVPARSLGSRIAEARRATYAYAA